jgi:hypothetical protein
MGSGTTWIACKKLNRNFIWIEKDEEYFKIAECRISNNLINNKNVGIDITIFSNMTNIWFGRTPTNITNNIKIILIINIFKIR